MHKINLFITLALISTLLNACSGSLNVPAQVGSLKVLATESFLGDIAQNVAGDRITVDILIPVTMEPEEFEPVPQDITKISQSQILIVNGLGYETWLKKTLDNVSSQQQVIVVTRGLTSNPDPSGERAEGDPHLWMNPLNVIRYVENIRDGLSQADPAGKDVYARNADTYIAKLKDLDGWIKNQVSQLPVEKRLLVTNHDALGYFAQAYNFKVVGAVIPALSPNALPSAQEMANLIDTIENSGAPAIFMDIHENQNLAQQIASETGVQIVTDIYVESISAPDGPAPTYIDMIKYDVLQIISALK